MSVLSAFMGSGWPFTVFSGLISVPHHAFWHSVCTLHSSHTVTCTSCSPFQSVPLSVKLPPHTNTFLPFVSRTWQVWLGPGNLEAPYPRITSWLHLALPQTEVKLLENKNGRSLPFYSVFPFSTSPSSSLPILHLHFCIQHADTH